MSFLCFREHKCERAKHKYFLPYYEILSALIYFYSKYLNYIGTYSNTNMYHPSSENIIQLSGQITCFNTSIMFSYLV